MGVVFKAYDPDLDRAVALKVLQTVTGHSKTAHDRLLREAQALARLQHPNVVAVYDVGPFGGDVFIAMEFVEGKTLRQWLKDRPRSQREVIDAYLAAGEGLLAAHRAGLMHRDFKPDNVIVGNDGRVRVLDFGLARAAGIRPEPGSDTPPPDVAEAAPVIEPGSSSLLEKQLTRVGATVGTPRFMAPEQQMGGSVDERADQFSFCVALYHSLYGGYPFGPLAAERAFGDMVAERVAEPPAGSKVPRWLRQVLLRGLRARPDDRYPSMVELLAALRADPSVAYRRWLRVAAAAAVIAGVGIGWRASVRQQVRACAGADRKLVGVWDEARREAVRAAFRRSNKPYARAVLSSVEETMDRYARAWATMHVDACEATHVRKEQSQELLDLRMACLGDRLTQLSTLSELFSHADDALVQRAAESAQLLPALDLCADAVALRAPTPPPRDGNARAQVTRIRHELARAHALELAAQYDEAVTLTRTAIADLAPTSYAPAQAEAQVLLGNLLTDQGEYAAAATALRQAFVLALAGRHEEEAARAAIQLVHTLGVYQSQHSEGHYWASVAEALVGRVQQRDELTSLLAHKLSMLLQEEGKYDEARMQSQRALAVGKILWGPDDVRMGMYHHELGNVYYLQGRYDEALESYRQSAAIQRKVFGDHHPGLAANILSVANVLGDRGEHQRALAENERALAILARVQVAHPWVPQILNTMGADLLALGRFKEAFDKFQQAYEGWQKLVGESADIATALENLGTCKRRLKEPVAALGYVQRALDMCGRVVGPEHRLYGQILSALGDVYVDLHQVDEALARYRRALAVSEKTLGREHPQVAGVLMGLARVAVERHAAGEAKEPLERALAIYEKNGAVDDVAIARFALAKALWLAPQSPADRSRAVALAEQARGTFAKLAGDASNPQLAEVTAWLAAHR
jgi:tetratricopeptide (TPR) repeat protein